MAIEGVSGTGLEAQSSQTDAVKSLISWESPHPLSIVGVLLQARWRSAHQSPVAQRVAGSSFLLYREPLSRVPRRAPAPVQRSGHTPDPGGRAGEVSWRGRAAEADLRAPSAGSQGARADLAGGGCSHPPPRSPARRQYD